MTSAPQARTLLLSDLVDSTALVERVGDARWAGLSARHDRVARDIFSQYQGTEIDKTDGFLVLFERPIDAVRAALAYHAALSADEQLGPERVSARVGIHFAEVILRKNPAEDVARGAKPIEVEGLAKPTAARIMSLATGRQTLLGRAAFDMARRAGVGSDAVAPEVQWLAHGNYEIKGVSEPIELCEVGLTGTAPLKAPPDTSKVRRLLAAGEAELLGWRPAPGGAIPGRENWVLGDKLGEGGFGEVWLATHRKTRDTRVFKFCFDVERLRGLKREVTLFRLLKETLGDRDDIARVIDWSFESAPFFIEGEYTPGGDLTDWSEAQGGIAALPLAHRLELVAETATALAAAHSVGVLHKDIKPSNILVYKDTQGVSHARLTDFGIGIITDKERLAQAGVTATGMTESTLLGNDSSRTGTRLYMAPELLEGKPATIQADIYALGVLLYQIVTGDFGRALTVDWRDEVEDPILCEDIAACVAGDARKRLAGAGELAERLRSLEARRAERAREQRDKAEAEAVKLALERVKRRRKFAILVGSIGTVVLLGMTGLYWRAEEARRDAEVARGEAEQSRELAQNRADELELTLRRLQESEVKVAEETTRAETAATQAATSAETAEQEKYRAAIQTAARIILGPEPEVPTYGSDKYKAALDALRSTGDKYLEHWEGRLLAGAAIDGNGIVRLGTGWGETMIHARGETSPISIPPSSLYLRKFLTSTEELAIGFFSLPRVDKQMGGVVWNTQTGQVLYCIDAPAGAMDYSSRFFNRRSDSTFSADDSRIFWGDSVFVAETGVLEGRFLINDDKSKSQMPPLGEDSRPHKALGLTADAQMMFTRASTDQHGSDVGATALLGYHRLEETPIKISLFGPDDSSGTLIPYANKVLASSYHENDEYSLWVQASGSWSRGDSLPLEQHSGFSRKSNVWAIAKGSVLTDYATHPGAIILYDLRNHGQVPSVTLDKTSILIPTLHSLISLTHPVEHPEKLSLFSLETFSKISLGELPSLSLVDSTSKLFSLRRFFTEEGGDVNTIRSAGRNALAFTDDAVIVSTGDRGRDAYLLRKGFDEYWKALHYVESDGRLLVLSEEQGDITLWDSVEGVESPIGTVTGETVVCGVFCEAGPVAIGTLEGNVHLLGERPDGRSELKAIYVDPGEPIRDLQLSEDVRKLAILTKQKLVIYDLQNDLLSVTHEHVERSYLSVALNPDGSRAALATFDEIYIVNVQTGHELFAISAGDWANCASMPGVSKVISTGLSNASPVVFVAASGARLNGLLSKISDSPRDGGEQHASEHALGEMAQIGGTMNSAPTVSFSNSEYWRSLQVLRASLPTEETSPSISPAILKTILNDTRSTDSLTALTALSSLSRLVDQFGTDDSLLIKDFILSSALPHYENIQNEASWLLSNSSESLSPNEAEIPSAAICTLIASEGFYAWSQWTKDREGLAPLSKSFLWDSLILLVIPCAERSNPEGSDSLEFHGWKYWNDSAYLASLVLCEIYDDVTEHGVYSEYAGGVLLGRMVETLTLAVNQNSRFSGGSDSLTQASDLVSITRLGTDLTNLGENAPQSSAVNSMVSDYGRRLMALAPINERWAASFIEYPEGLVRQDLQLSRGHDGGVAFGGGHTMSQPYPRLLDEFLSSGLSALSGSRSTFASNASHLQPPSYEAAEAILLSVPLAFPRQSRKPKFTPLSPVDRKTLELLEVVYPPGFRSEAYAGQPLSTAPDKISFHTDDSSSIDARGCVATHLVSPYSLDRLLFSVLEFANSAPDIATTDRALLEDLRCRSEWLDTLNDFQTAHDRWNPRYYSNDTVGLNLSSRIDQLLDLPSPYSDLAVLMRSQFLILTNQDISLPWNPGAIWDWCSWHRTNSSPQLAAQFENRVLAALSASRGKDENADRGLERFLEKCPSSMREAYTSSPFAAMRPEVHETPLEFLDRVAPRPDFSQLIEEKMVYPPIYYTPEQYDQIARDMLLKAAVILMEYSDLMKDVAVPAAPSTTE